MRRIKLAVVVGVVMAAMLVFSAGPALADDFDFDGIDDGIFFDNNDFCDVFDCFGFAGAPATLEFDQDIGDTGDVTLTTDVSSTGDSSNQTVAPLQFGNTGNLQNAQGFVQFDSTADDIEFEGSSFSFAPVLTNTSNQAVQQSSGAGGKHR